MDLDHSFTPSDADAVTREYVCAVCFHDLEIVQVPNEFHVLVVCPIHGDCTVVGRVTRATVSIQAENESLQFHTAIQNLADLFPEMQNAGMTREAALKLQRYNVCAVCGGLMDVTALDNQFTAYQLTCRRHKGGGHIQKTKFKYDFRAMKAWESEHKKGS